MALSVPPTPLSIDFSAVPAGACFAASICAFGWNARPIAARPGLDAPKSGEWCFLDGGRRPGAIKPEGDGSSLRTAWHITDWLWQSTPEIRAVLAKRYGLQFSEGSKSALRNGLEEFQDAVAKESRHLYVCREIANGSKHMRKNNVDPDVTALARWDRVAQGAGCVQPGDLTMSLVIIDGDHEEDAARWFIQAFGYWEELFSIEKLVVISDRLPDKTIAKA